MEKWDGNEGTSAFHMPEWMVSSSVALLFLVFLDNKATVSDRCQRLIACEKFPSKTCGWENTYYSNF